MEYIRNLLITFYNWLFKKNKQNNKEVKKEFTDTESWIEKSANNFYNIQKISPINPLEVNSFTKDKFDKFNNKIELGDLMLFKKARLLYLKPVFQDVYFIVTEEHMLRSDRYIHKEYYSHKTEFGIDIIAYNMMLSNSELVEKIDLNYYIQKEKLKNE